MRLSDQQTEVLLKPIVKSRVQERDGMSYVETWDIRAMMNRVFGFCEWSLISTSPTTLVFEREKTLGNGKPGYCVAYKAELELIVHTPQGDARYAGSAIGEATMPDYKLGDAHDMAAKSAESGALKRAATNLGDQFGLSLYRKGDGLQPVVRKVVGFHDEPAPTPAAEPQTAPAAVEQPTAGQSGDAVPPTASPAPSELNPAITERFNKLSNVKKVAFSKACAGNGIQTFLQPEPEHLDRVLVLLGKIEKGEPVT